jgi:regulator of replication initiation timing
MTIATMEQRLAGVIGQIIVENAALGAEVERLRLELAREKARADTAEQSLKTRNE